MRMGKGWWELGNHPNQHMVQVRHQALSLAKGSGCMQLPLLLAASSQLMFQARIFLAKRGRTLHAVPVRFNRSCHLPPHISQPTLAFLRWMQLHCLHSTLGSRQEKVKAWCYQRRASNCLVLTHCKPRAALM